MAKPNPWILLGVVMVGNFLGPLNSSIATVALPNLMSSFGADLGTISWVITGYMLGYAVSMPTAGWLADTFGRKRMYMTGLVIFTVASILASLAWNPVSLIGFRVLQAVGGGFLSATSMAVIVQFFPVNQLGRALGVWGLGMVLAPALGPYVGGYLIDLVDWRFIFLIGMPFGVAGLILSYFLLPDDTERIHRRFDVVGFLSLTASLLMFLYALSQGNTSGWDSPVIVGCFFGAALSFAFFIPWEMHTADPLMELHLFKTWNFSIAVALRALLGAGYYMGIVLIPVFVQDQLGYTPLQSGAVLVPAGLAMALAMPVAGTLSDRLGARSFVVVGLVIATIASFAFRDLDSDWSFSLLATVMLWRSLGLGLLFTPLTSAALWNVPRNLGGRASGIINTVWQVGGSIGIAASTAYTTIRLKERYTDLSSHVTAYQPAVQQYLAQTSRWAAMHGLAPNAAMAMLQARLTAAATVLSYQDAFVISAIMLACAIPLAFALRRRPSGVIVLDVSSHASAPVEVVSEETEAVVTSGAAQGPDSDDPEKSRSIGNVSRRRRTMGQLYHEGSRILQDRFDTRRLADRIESRKIADRIDEEDREFIESRDMFFLATVDHRGYPTCSYKGGDPGFVRVLDEHTIVFPNYDGNGMYLSLGNAAAQAKVGILFIDFEDPSRLRIHGDASIDLEDSLAASYPEAQFVVRVQVREVFPNCPRYVHRYALVERSRFVPKSGEATPFPDWKRSEWAADVLPNSDHPV